jgi:hypothetical protein
MVRVAVVAGRHQEVVHVPGHGKTMADFIMALARTEIAGGTDELDSDQEGEAEQDDETGAFFHGRRRDDSGRGKRHGGHDPSE